MQEKCITSPSVDDVALALGPQLPCLARPCFAAQGDVVAVGDGFRADEALLEIRVDLARRFWSRRAGVNGPGARFLGTDGEEGQQVEQFIPRADHAGEAGLA